MPLVLYCQFATRRSGELLQAQQVAELGGLAAGHFHRRATAQGHHQVAGNARIDFLDPLEIDKALIPKLAPDLVFLDIQMPGMSGRIMGCPWPATLTRSASWASSRDEIVRATNSVFIAPFLGRPARRVPCFG